MTAGIEIRKVGKVGRITLNRPAALNALTWEMVRAIEAALELWANDASMAMLVIDGEGPKAFCAGGDIAEMYATASAGDFDYGRRFWRDEYRMNAKLYNFPKPVASFLQGFTMGGGVGVGCHGSHRMVGETSKIAMPECGIGLVPDVGGSLILAQAPGRLGEYLGVTAARMGPGDAIHAGFADYYVPEAAWADLTRELELTGDWQAVDEAALEPPASPMAARQGEIDAAFGGGSLRASLDALTASGSDFAAETLAQIVRNSPLSMACTVELIGRVRAADTIEAALTNEFRFTWRSAEQGDFVEGIRAKIIDKDNAPKWRHADAYAPTAAEIERMLAPLGADDLDWEERK